MKKKIEELLLSTGREGMANLLEYMDKQGFYSAPCSTQYHLCKVGGLAEHSMNVFNTMFNMAASLDFLKPRVEDTEIKNSIIIVSLLHDIGKIGIDGQPYYTENFLKNGKRSDAKPYESNKELGGIPHEIISVSIISRFIKLTANEYQAIIYHNGLYTPLGYGIKGKENELYLLLHSADMWASRILERSK